MSDLIDTTEMYLRTIYELVEEGVPPLRARIVERLGQSGPTVSQTVARMERDGLLVVGGDRQIELSAEGQVMAARVMRKHRLAECLLTQVLGLEWERVHEEACRWEHVISDAVERRIVSLLAGPLVSPYGNPIPALDELGAASPAASGAVALSTLVGSSPRDLRLDSIGEVLQGDPGVLAALAGAGVRPGARVGASTDGPSVRLTAGAGSVTVDAEVAAHLFAVA